MNIFYLNESPILAAQDHCDKHCVKMILESAQLLSTAHRVLDGVQGTYKSAGGRNLKEWVLPDERNELLYKATHVNHPCAIWCRDTDKNYLWLYDLFVQLCVEYTRRYKKIHLCQTKLLDALALVPDNIKIGIFTEPPQAMPDECKVPGNAVKAYQNYYKTHKSEIAVWAHSTKPEWFN